MAFGFFARLAFGWPVPSVCGSPPLLEVPSVCRGAPSRLSFWRRRPTDFRLSCSQVRRPRSACPTPGRGTALDSAAFALGFRVLFPCARPPPLLLPRPVTGLIQLARRSDSICRRGLLIVLNHFFFEPVHLSPARHSARAHWTRATCLAFFPPPCSTVSPSPPLFPRFFFTAFRLGFLSPFPNVRAL